MIVGGIQKNSLIDYPGKISCVLFTVGCNFRCPYCHNPSLVPRDSDNPVSPLSEKAIFGFLERRRPFLDGVVISGGEPTLQSDIGPFCERVKEMGYAVKLDTNGSRPGVVRHLIQNDLADYIAMDLKTLPDLYGTFLETRCGPRAILSSIQMIMDSGKAYEFRTTCVKPMINDRIMEDLARLIKGARLYALQRFVPAHVLRPECFQGTDSLCTVQEIHRLRFIVEKWVQKCVVRA